MPLDDNYNVQIHGSNADLQNVRPELHVCLEINCICFIQTGGKDAGSATAAMFLKPFAHGIEAEEGQEPALKWAHIDIAGAMEVSPGFIWYLCLRSWLMICDYRLFT